MDDMDDVCKRNPHGNLAWRKVWFMCSRSASESESEWWVYFVSELMFVLWTTLHQKWHAGHTETARHRHCVAATPWTRATLAHN